MFVTSLDARVVLDGKGVRHRSVLPAAQSMGNSPLDKLIYIHRHEIENMLYLKDWRRILCGRFAKTLVSSIYIAAVMFGAMDEPLG